MFEISIFRPFRNRFDKFSNSASISINFWPKRKNYKFYPVFGVNCTSFRKVVNVRQNRNYFSLARRNNIFQYFWSISIKSHKKYQNAKKYSTKPIYHFIFSLLLLKCKIKLQFFFKSSIFLSEKIDDKK